MCEVRAIDSRQVPLSWARIQAILARLEALEMHAVQDGTELVVLRRQLSRAMIHPLGHKWLWQITEYLNGLNSQSTESIEPL